jgi:hypothetical protein
MLAACATLPLQYSLRPPVLKTNLPLRFFSSVSICFTFGLFSDFPRFRFPRRRFQPPLLHISTQTLNFLHGPGFAPIPNMIIEKLAASAMPQSMDALISKFFTYFVFSKSARPFNPPGNPMAGYNIIRTISYLNTPSRIYDEWTKMAQSAPVEIPSVGQTRSAVTFTQPNERVPSLEDLETYMAEQFSLLDSFIASSDTNPIDVRASIHHLARRIQEYVVFYYNIPDTPSIRRALTDPAKESRLDHALAQFRNVVSVLLSQIGRLLIHTEFLVNPVSPQRPLWVKVGDLQNEVFNSAIGYLDALRRICELVSYDNISKDLLSKCVAPPGSTEIVSESPIQKQQTSHLPTIVNFKEFLRELNDIGRFYSRSPGDLANLQRIVATIESLRPSINEIDDQFRTLDDAVCQIYGAQSQDHFQAGYANSWQELGTIAKMTQRGARHVDPSVIASFVVGMSRAVRSFERLICEIEGAPPPAPESVYRPKRPVSVLDWLGDCGGLDAF